MLSLRTNTETMRAITVTAKSSPIQPQKLSFVPKPRLFWYNALSSRGANSAIHRHSKPYLTGESHYTQLNSLNTVDVFTKSPPNKIAGNVMRLDTADADSLLSLAALIMKPRPAAA